jgi:hypothetical protein
MKKSSLHNVQNELVVDLADISYVTALNAYSNWTIGFKNGTELSVEIINSEDAGEERTSLVF